MKRFVLIFALMLSAGIHAEDNCKNLKACSEWATGRTGVKYELGKFEKRSLKMDKDFSLADGDADFLFNYILQNNDLVRLKRDNGTYQIINAREMKDFQFPTVKAEEIPSTLDFFTAEFTLGSKERVSNARTILKKYLSKNGRLLEVSDAPKLQVLETGLQLNAIKLMINELNK